MASPAKKATREEQSPETSLQSPVAGIEAVLRALEQALYAAQTELGDAEAAVQQAETAAGAAKTAHDASPTDAAAAAEYKTGLALARAIRVRDAARARASTALGDVGTAEAKLVDARREVRKGELREAAAPLTIAAAIGPHWAALIDANARATAATKAIAAAWADSVAASAELRKLGEHVVDLDRLHALLPGLRSIAENGAVADLDQVRHTPITTAALAALLATAVRPELAHHVAPFRARLERHARTRTGYEASALEKTELEAAQAARESSPEGQENARRQAEHNERTKQPRFRGYDQ
jgi:hypothetical protein